MKLYRGQYYSYFHDFWSFRIAATMPKRVRVNTPPPGLALTVVDAQLKTPKRAAIFSVFYFCQQQHLPCTLEQVKETFGIPTTTSARVLRSKRCRRFQNSRDQEDPQGLPRQLTAADATAIALYIRQAPFNEKGDSWQDLAERAGVVKEYIHERGKENIQFHAETIQQRVTIATGIKTHRAIVKEEHTEPQRVARIQYCSEQLAMRPLPKDWHNVIWCDELHWMTGPRYRKDIKRDAGDDVKYHLSNI
jgi:hypothetical protein